MRSGRLYGIAVPRRRADLTLPTSCGSHSVATNTKRFTLCRSRLVCVVVASLPTVWSWRESSRLLAPSDCIDGAHFFKVHRTRLGATSAKDHDLATSKCPYRPALLSSLEGRGSMRSASSSLSTWSSEDGSSRSSERCFRLARPQGTSRDGTERGPTMGDGGGAGGSSVACCVDSLWPSWPPCSCPCR